jgi:2-dehydropantoate 2-reductase
MPRGPHLLAMQVRGLKVISSEGDFEVKPNVSGDLHAIGLLGNIAFNPISALTGGTLEELARHPDVSKVVRALMTETQAVAQRPTIDLPTSIDQRMAGAEKVGAHKTSMLQDLEAGRPMELDTIIGAVVELGERLGVAMPATQTVYACAKMLDDKRRSVS